MNNETKQYRKHPDTPDGYFWSTNFDQEFSEIPANLNQQSIKFKLGPAYNTLGEVSPGHTALFIKFKDESRYKKAIQELFGDKA